MQFSKIIGFCAVGLLSVTGVWAQSGRIVTPFTPREVDSTGRKVYVQPQRERQSRIAVTFSYGYGAVTSFNSYANRHFPFHYNPLPNEPFPAGRINSNFGTVSIGFNYEITPWLELNIPFVYSHNKGWQECRITDTQDNSGRQVDDWLTLLPSLRINWMRNNWLSLYTRAGIGLGLGSRWVACDADQSTKALLGYQISPLGVEMGKGKLCFFVEGGYGFTGYVTAGLKLKVGKVLKDGRTSTGRQVNWYDKYLH